MKRKLNKETILKVILVVAIILILPFSVEFMFVLDFMGMESLVILVLLYLKDYKNIVTYKWHRFERCLLEIPIFLSQLIMFQPKNYAIHATASSVFLLVFGSVLFAYLVWVPIMLMSSGCFI